MKRITVYKKKQLQLDKFNVNQTYMLKIGTVALATVKNRIQQGVNGSDAKAKPLSRGYAIQKSKLGLRNIRDLTFTGNMLRNLQVRSVSENQSSATLTTRKDRTKAKVQNNTEPFLVYSDNDRRKIAEPLHKILEEMLQRLSRSLPGNP